MTTTKRELIVQDIVAALEKISIISGYNTDVASVQRFGNEVTEIIDRPFVAVRSVSGEQTNASVETVWLETLTVAIACFPDEPQGETPVDAHIDKLLHDVQKAVMVDPQRSGLANDTEYAGWEWFDEDEEDIGALLMLNIDYYHSYEDPAL